MYQLILFFNGSGLWRVSGVEFRDVADGRTEAAAGREALGALFPLAPFSNGFLHGKAGVAQLGMA